MDKVCRHLLQYGEFGQGGTALGLGQGVQHEGVAQGVVEAVAVDKCGAVEKEVGTNDVVDSFVGDGFVEREGGVVVQGVVGGEEVVVFHLYALQQCCGRGGKGGYAMGQDAGGQLLIAPLAVNGVVDVVGTWEVLIVKSVLVAVAQDLGISAGQQGVAKSLFGRGEVGKGVAEEGFGVGVHWQFFAHSGHAEGRPQKKVGLAVGFGAFVFLQQEGVGVGIGTGFGK